MNEYWSPIARKLSPYVPGEQPRVHDLIKLNTNEHPLPPSELAMSALRRVEPERLRRYPDPESESLRTAIAEAEGVDRGQVFVGNGSDEVLGHIYAAFFAGRGALTALDISYGFYPVWAQLYGVELKAVPLTERFEIDVPAVSQTSGPIIFANPNAPTGIALTAEAIGRLAEARACRLVVVDEAYYGFGAETAVGLVGRYPNLLVTRSLSKSHALAGLRVGYAIGDEGLIEGLNRVKNSFNSYPLGALAQAGAEAAIRDVDWLARAGRVVIDNRSFLTAELERLGFEVCSSLANFVFARHPNRSGKFLFGELRRENILVRHWDKPRIGDHLRITVGSREQCERLIEALGGIIDRPEAG